MVVKTLVKKGSYQDSVALMRISRQVRASSGIKQASVMMATAQNKEVLREAGLFNELAASAGPGDMVVAVEAESEEAGSAALTLVEQVLAAPAAPEAAGVQTPRYRTVAAGAGFLKGANLAVISVPGVYAAAEALKALKNGLNVFLFSDNVPLKDEIDLKHFAHERGLLVMGPDCGTAFVGGIPLGFANAVRRGGIGLVGASGTGLQEVMSLIDRWGGGVSQAFGTGGRDLSERVGGATMLDALGVLSEDPGTRVIVLVSKPPAPGVARAILDQAAGVSKLVVVCFLGYKVHYPDRRGVFLASTLEEAAQTAVFLEQGRKPEPGIPDTAFQLQPGRGYLRGLFSGGTLADEALLVAEGRIGDVFSNLGGAAKLENPYHSQKNTIVDMGDDEFTVGRPHPMLDFSYRVERFLREAGDPEVGVILMDVVLGFGSNPDPALELAPAIVDALNQARFDGRDLKIVISLVGTDSDPQSYRAQAEKFRAAGAIVASTNAQAARLAVRLLAGQTKERTTGGAN